MIFRTLLSSSSEFYYGKIMINKYVLKWFSHIVLNIKKLNIKTHFRKLKTINKKLINLRIHLIDDTQYYQI